MDKKIEYLLNWKKNPASVFFFVIPLAAIGFGFSFTGAVLQYNLNNDPWYLVIFMAGMGFLGLGLWPIRKQLLALLK